MVRTGVVRQEKDFRLRQEWDRTSGFLRPRRRSPQCEQNTEQILFRMK